MSPLRTKWLSTQLTFIPSIVSCETLSNYLIRYFQQRIVFQNSHKNNIVFLFSNLIRFPNLSIYMHGKSAQLQVFLEGSINPWSSWKNWGPKMINFIKHVWCYTYVVMSWNQEKCSCVVVKLYPRLLLKVTSLARVIISLGMSKIFFLQIAEWSQMGHFSTHKLKESYTKR